jgi:hypothetical protein
MSGCTPGGRVPVDSPHHLDRHAVGFYDGDGDCDAGEAFGVGLLGRRLEVMVPVTSHTAARVLKIVPWIWMLRWSRSTRWSGSSV